MEARWADQPGDRAKGRVVVGWALTFRPLVAPLLLLKRFAKRLQSCDAVGHERVLEGPQDEGARRRRAWHPQEGGVSELLGISLATISRYYVKLKASGEDLAPKSPPRAAKRRSSTAPPPTRMPCGTSSKRTTTHGYPRRAPRDVREGGERGVFRLRGDDEPRRGTQEARGWTFKKKIAGSL